jgi:transcriptional regulator with XRE-family HTH domain
MASQRLQINLEELSTRLKTARQRKSWTLERLAYELWNLGFPTAQNKLWRMENNPPRRLDMELLLWLEKVLEVELLPAAEKKQVLIDDVLDLIDGFIAARHKGNAPPPPASAALSEIHRRLHQLSTQPAESHS